MQSLDKAAPADRGGGKTAFAVTVVFELVDGAFASFHRLVSENAAQSVASEAGCLRFDVLTPEGGGEGDVLLYEIYVDRAAFDVHLATAHFKTFDAATRDLVRQKTIATFRVAENAGANGSAG